MEPPHVRPGGPAIPLTDAAWRAVARPDAKAKFGQSAKTATAKVSGASAAVVGADSLVLRRGFTMGDTSLIVYFDVQDASLTSWQASVFDAETGTEQKSTTLTPSDLAVCGSPRRYCRAFGSADGWTLDADKKYFVSITATYPDGTSVTSPPSNQSQPRRVELPPAIPAAQASACACEDVLGRSSAGQQVRGFGVNTGTGAYSRTEADLSLESYAVPFSGGRWYNSANQTAGHLGLGWSWQYDVSVASTDDGAVVRAEDGAQAVYTRQDDGTYRRPAGVRSKLARSGSGWKLTTPEHNTLTFDSAGKPLSILDARGHGLKLAYSGGFLSTITDAAGRVIKVTYRTDIGLIRRVDLPDGRFVQFDYDGRRMITAQAPNGRTTQYRYDATGRLWQVVDPRGQVQATTTYDPATGRVTKQTDVFGKATTFGWDAAKGEATTTDADGIVYHDGYKNNHLVYTQNGNGDVHHVRYDANGGTNLTVDGNGNQDESAYDADGNATGRTAPEPFSFTEKATYQDNEPTSFTDGNGKTWKAEYNEFHEITKKTDAKKNSWTYKYDNRGLKISETDPRDKTTTWEYDNDGNQIAKITPSGRRYEFGYDKSSRKISTTDPRGTVNGGADKAKYTTTYTFDESDRQTSVTMPGKKTAYKRYDELGRLSDDIDPFGEKLHYTYDVANRLVERSDKLGNITKFGYTDAGRRASQTDALGGLTTLSYNKKGLLETSVSPRGNQAGATKADFTTTYFYDQNDNLLRSRHPAPGGGTVTQDLRYDELDRNTTAIEPDGSQTSGTFDNGDNLTTVEDPNKGSTSFEYDDNGEPTSQSGPNGNVVKVEYDDSGNVVKQVNATGGVTTMTYDDDDRLITAVEPRGHVDGADAGDFTTKFGYDVAGNRTTVTDPLGNVTKDVFDANNRIVSHVDANQHVTSYTFDDLDRVVSVTAPDSINNRSTIYKYDANDNVLSRTDPHGNAQSATYDRLDRVTSTFDSLGRLREYGYDAESNLTAIVTARTEPNPLNPSADPERAKRTITQEFDQLGRMVKRQLGTTGPVYTFGYDSKGRVISTTDPAGASTRKYDDNDQLREVKRGNLTYSYSYDSNGNLTSRGNPDGTTMSAEYDGDDRMTSLTQAGRTWTFGYDATGHRTSTELPGDAVEKRTFDNAGRLTGIDTRDGDKALGKFQLTLDPVGNPTRISTTRGDVTEDVAYTFDAADRLTAACYGTTDCARAGTGKISYAYDLVGNRTSQVRTGSAGSDSAVYKYDTTDQLTTRTVTGAGAGVTEYQYDNEGNQTRAGADTFTYNLDHTQASATVNGKTATFGYDTDGNRITTTIGTGATALTRTSDWDINDPQITSEREATGDGAAAVVRSFVTGPDGENLALLDGDRNVTSLYVHDWLNGTSALVAPGGAVQALYDYDPYGQPRVSPTRGGLTTAPDPGATANPLRFAGGYADTAALGDAYHLQARNYDPSTGRFNSKDPAPRADGQAAISSYLYADGAPTVMTDPNGLWSIGGALKSIGDGVSTAYKATAEFVDKHQADIVGVAAGIAAGAACTVATGGAGVVGCAAVGGAAASAATYAWKTKVQKQGEFSWAGLAKQTATGAVTGALLGAAGKYVNKIPAVNRLTSKAGGLLKSGIGKLTSPVKAAAGKLLGAGQSLLASAGKALLPRVNAMSTGYARAALSNLRAGLVRYSNASQVAKNKAVGDAASDNIAARYPGSLREVALRAPSGIRRIDVLTARGLAIESKVGRISLTPEIKQEIARDVELLNMTGSRVNDVLWEFRASPFTGAKGPTGPLRDALNNAKIPFVIR
ncbi:RHS repeat-associated protein [Actinoplanes octamycinicus]|uniref:RHS repeat-associated protein n=1 Tax=Actinoplanes octamycinicus TaxID=135948 RepID=A0A7W7M969_9ACTN|nr:RHS repeat-associated core domain-containing protein [Actinoplanes octamycinicus]MBB4741617.1 RHS repeat-associated protein [Actinoplanes octamycinicus]GIE57169.1 hypothetical protein Aoc01nite_25710 [Actinoplanes octamycinicus]